MYKIYFDEETLDVLDEELREVLRCSEELREKISRLNDRGMCIHFAKAKKIEPENGK